jgi:hypothetical protein
MTRLYSRQGPRPPLPTAPEDLAQTRSEAESIVPASDSQGTLKPEADDLMSFDDTPPNEMEDHSIESEMEEDTVKPQGNNASGGDTSMAYDLI